MADETMKVTAEQARAALELMPSRWTLVGHTWELLEYATLAAYIDQTESAIATWELLEYAILAAYIDQTESAIAERKVPDGVPMAYVAENANEAFVFFANDHESLDAYTADGFSITPLVRHHQTQAAEPKVTP